MSCFSSIADAIPLDLLKAEQARIAAELDQLHADLKVTIADGERLRVPADTAVDFLNNCFKTYEAMKPQLRRLMNQAFFKKVWVTERGVIGWDYTNPSLPFATLEL